MTPAPALDRPCHVVITGARGRLAPLLRAAFVSRGWHVTGVSRRRGEDAVGYEELRAVARHRPVDVLLHLAWSVVPATAEQPDADSRANRDLLHSLLEECPHLGSANRPTQFVFFSSGGSVYGNSATPSRETDPCRPVGAYGRLKLEAEQTVLAHQDRLPCTVLRISNPYGFCPQTTKPQGIIPFAFAAARDGTPLDLWGDGTAVKDFLHHDDFLAALAAVVQQRLCGLYNVAAGESHSIREVLAAVERETGRTLTVRHSPARAWDVHDSRLDNSKLRAATGWSPRVSLATGLRRMAREMLPAPTSAT